jgi:hypothetical protein
VSLRVNNKFEWHEPRSFEFPILNAEVRILSPAKRRATSSMLGRGFLAQPRRANLRKVSRRSRSSVPSAACSRCLRGPGCLRQAGSLALA